MGIDLIFIVSAFIAGFLMFLAPCTLPLIPAYLAFISGVRETSHQLRKIQLNAVAFVCGFTVVFVSFGVLAGFAGSFVVPLKSLLTYIGGVFIIFFGLMMLGVFHISFLERRVSLSLPKSVHPGTAASAFLIGAIFALGWTPCIGPILATILLLATTKATAISGGFLLFVFSMGLALPFLLTALFYAHASKYINKYSVLTNAITYVGAVFLILIGILLLTDNFGLTISYGYKILESVGLGNLLKYY